MLDFLTVSLLGLIFLWIAVSLAMIPYYILRSIFDPDFRKEMMEEDTPAGGAGAFTAMQDGS